MHTVRFQRDDPLFFNKNKNGNSIDFALILSQPISINKIILITHAKLCSNCICHCENVREWLVCALELLLN